MTESIRFMRGPTILIGTAGLGSNEISSLAGVEFTVPCLIFTILTTQTVCYYNIFSSRCTGILIKLEAEKCRMLDHLTDKAVLLVDILEY